MQTTVLVDGDGREPSEELALKEGGREVFLVAAQLEDDIFERAALVGAAFAELKHAPNGILLFRLGIE